MLLAVRDRTELLARMEARTKPSGLGWFHTFALGSEICRLGRVNKAS